jgi:signal transduction histidine kinase
VDDGQLPHTGGDRTEAEHEEAAPDELERLRRDVAEVRASRARLVRAADADRRAIERELHAGVQQDLVALAVSLQLAEQLLEADPGAAQGLLEEMRGDVQRAIETTALLAERIAPPLLESGGLAVTLRSAFARAGVAVSLDVAAAVRYPPAVAATVYQCCLRVLTGATPGASASVSVHGRDDAAVFEIHMDGGVDGELGLLRDRIEALGGALTITPESSGIRLSGSLPRTR